jgi:isoquinoline 1-oxidoreductase beta subunit
MEFANGGVKFENFGDYELLSMGDAPDLDVPIVKSRAKLGGIGELGLPLVPQAVANALSRATGAGARETAADESGYGTRGDDTGVRTR